MTITESDIERLKRELEDDLRAIQRVETIFSKRNSKPESATASIQKAPTPAVLPEAEKPKVSQTSAELVLTEPARATFKGELRGMVIEAIKAAGPAGIRPRDIVAKVEAAGYPFKNRDALASVVSTCVQRLWKRDNLVEKTGERTYFWK